MKTEVEKLKAARALIEKGWTQKWFARDAAGDVCNSSSPNAVCWCVIGACHATGIPDDTIAYMARTQKIAYLPRWNDAPDRTQAEVLALFDKAIALAERDAAGVAGIGQ